MPHCPFSVNWFNQIFYTEQIFTKKENRKEITFVRTRQLHTPFQIIQQPSEICIIIKKDSRFQGGCYWLKLTI